MNDEVQKDPSSNCGEISLLEIALKNDISGISDSELSFMEISINEQIENEEEEKRLQELKRIKEEKEREEKLRLKIEEDTRKKQEQDKLKRFLALKSLDEMVKSFHFSK